MRTDSEGNVVTLNRDKEKTKTDVIATPKKKLAIISSSSSETSYGGIGPFIKNMDPFLSVSFDTTYVRLPDKLQKKGIIPTRLKFLIYLLWHKKKLSDFDVILSHDPEGSYVASFTGIPFIHILHGDANALTSPRFWYGRYFRWIYDSFDKRIAKKAAIRYTVGAQKAGFRKLINPVHHQIQIKPPDERSGFIFCGRLEKVKNIDRIIRSYALLPAEVRAHHHFFIAGEGSRETELKTLVDQLRLTKNVMFTGNMPNEKLIERVSGKKILLMASSTEGFPMAIAEALSVGLPVISTDVGDIPGVIKNGENGLLLPVDFSFENYASSILKILNDYPSFSKRAFDSAAIFNAEAISSSITEELKKIAL